MDQTSGTWLWRTGAKNLELRLIHLPTGVTIDVDGAAVVLKREGKMTYLYWAKDSEDARSWIAELGRTLGAVDVRPSCSEGSNNAG